MKGCKDPIQVEHCSFSGSKIGCTVKDLFRTFSQDYSIFMHQEHQDKKMLPRRMGVAKPVFLSGLAAAGLAVWGIVFKRAGFFFGVLDISLLISWSKLFRFNKFP